jgi:hypothetical protein
MAAAQQLDSVERSTSPPVYLHPLTGSDTRLAEGRRTVALRPQQIPNSLVSVAHHCLQTAERQAPPVSAVYRCLRPRGNGDNMTSESVVHSEAQQVCDSTKDSPNATAVDVAEGDSVEAEHEYGAYSGIEHHDGKWFQVGMRVVNSEAQPVVVATKHCSNATAADVAGGDSVEDEHEYGAYADIGHHGGKRSAKRVVNSEGQQLTVSTNNIPNRTAAEIAEADSVEAGHEYAPYLGIEHHDGKWFQVGKRVVNSESQQLFVSTKDSPNATASDGHEPSRLEQKPRASSRSEQSRTHRRAEPGRSCFPTSRALARASRLEPGAWGTL